MPQEKRSFTQRYVANPTQLLTLSLVAKTLHLGYLILGYKLFKTNDQQINQIASSFMRYHEP